MEKTDCQVCKRLIKEKHRNEIWWKICCIIFGALSIILGILYFGSGKVVDEKTIELTNTDIENSGDNGVVILGGNDNVIRGKIESPNYTPVICITVIASCAILVAGGVLIAHNIIFKNHN